MTEAFDLWLTNFKWFKYQKIILYNIYIHSPLLPFLEACNNKFWKKNYRLYNKHRAWSALWPWAKFSQKYGYYCICYIKKFPE